MSDLDYGMPVKQIKILNNIDLVYTDQGNSKQTIIFIHGLASYIPAWKKNIEDLKTSYRCIAIDLPGYGRSSKGNYDVSMDFFADAISDFCQKLNIQKVILAGHSMGGQISIATALKYPDLVDKLILIAPAGFETFNKGQRQWFRDAMTVDGVRLTTVEQIHVNYAYNFYDMPKDAQFMIDDRIAIRSAMDFTDYCYHVTQGVKAMVDSPVFDFLPSVRQKTLCVFGTNDNLIPNRYLNGGFTEKYAKMGAEKMPDCTLHMLNKAGHFVMFEKPAEVNQLIREFLK
ncbi:MAG TPA: alpha/beta hydrolase [Saprospiraceae bacterium]|nr:alpha/beta hydrolase [Saprospiraceae bacterium]HRO08467.1 alpha/beta hydrolase [Saprospiraceae bacterium]HRP41852.1 alpha/beta hydrolase [Saprospiraceae bacterium]